jgi:CRP-like cAMP-binding protein
LFQYVKETITFPAGHITTTAGGLLGELSLLDNKPHSSTCVAKTDVKLAPIDQQRFLFMIQETPFFAIEVMRVMADRLRRERIQA